MIRLATANLALFGAPATNLHLANSLVRGGTDGELSQTLNGRAILILTNPPFMPHFPALTCPDTKWPDTKWLKERTINHGSRWTRKFCSWNVT